MCKAEKKRKRDIDWLAIILTMYQKTIWNIAISVDIRTRIKINNNNKSIIDCNCIIKLNIKFWCCSGEGILVGVIVVVKIKS